MLGPSEGAILIHPSREMRICQITGMLSSHDHRTSALPLPCISKGEKLQHLGCNHVVPSVYYLHPASPWQVGLWALLEGTCSGSSATAHGACRDTLAIVKNFTSSTSQYLFVSDIVHEISKRGGEITRKCSLTCTSEGNGYEYTFDFGLM